MKMPTVSKLSLVVCLLTFAACGDDASPGDGPGDHTGTIMVHPYPDQPARKLVFDKEFNGCNIEKAAAICGGSDRWVIAGLGTELATDEEVAVDLDWCAPGGEAGEAYGLLEVGIGPIGSPHETLFVYLDDSVDVNASGTRIRFSAHYVGEELFEHGELVFDADCARGGIEIP